MEGIKEEQKAIEVDTGKDYPEPNAIPNKIDDIIKDCKKMADNVKAIEKDIQKAREGPNKGIVKALLPIAAKILDLDKRILSLAEKLEKLGQRLLTNGEDLREKEKYTPEIKPKFDKQGKFLENVGAKLHSIGQKFGVIADKIESVANKRGGDESQKLKDFAKQMKDLGEKVKLKGEAVKELGIRIQKLEPNVRDPALDKDLEEMQKILDDIVRDLEELRKVTTLTFKPCPVIY